MTWRPCLKPFSFEMLLQQKKLALDCSSKVKFTRTQFIYPRKYWFFFSFFFTCTCSHTIFMLTTWGNVLQIHRPPTEDSRLITHYNHCLHALTLWEHCSNAQASHCDCVSIFFPPRLFKAYHVTPWEELYYSGIIKLLRGTISQKKSGISTHTRTMTTTLFFWASSV